MLFLLVVEFQFVQLHQQILDLVLELSLLFDIAFVALSYSGDFLSESLHFLQKKILFPLLSLQCLLHFLKHHQMLDIVGVASDLDFSLNEVHHSLLVVEIRLSLLQVIVQVRLSVLSAHRLCDTEVGAGN